MSGSKYHARKVMVDGHNFDSVKEAARYSVLMQKQERGEISGLELQPEFRLIPAQRGKTRSERAVMYRADFRYRGADGMEHVEDVKGVRTREYMLKRKLMLYIHGIEVEEV